MYKPIGLSNKDVSQRISLGKVNITDKKTSRSLSDILRANILTRFNALLGVLLVIVLIVGSPIDALFGLVVVINSAIGIYQELRAKKTLDRLAILHAPHAIVVRDNNEITIPIDSIVLDDTIKLSSGDQIAADGKVLYSDGLEVDESLLTGESEPIYKQKTDQLLSGSIVVAGSAYMQATNVGIDSYSYKISKQVKKFSRVSSELVDGTNKLLGYISWIIIIVAPILVWGQITNSGSTVDEALVRSAAAIVGMIPEGLVLLTSMAFMIATIVLARRKVLVQQLPAVEGLARVDTVCLDKTGTLTDGKMVFDDLYVMDKAQKKNVESVLATFSNKPDSATLEALSSKFSDIETLVVTGNVPFSSARKWSSISVSRTSHWVLGAPEIILSDKTFENAASTYANDGKRVIAIAHSTDKPSATHLPKLSAVGLVVLKENVRSDAAKTLQYFKEQGVSLKVISGDNTLTVGAIAKSVGIATNGAYDARKLPSDPKKLSEVMEKYSVFGRVSPEQKRQMIKAMQNNGHIVAMTGDGVNDALAMKDADVGIAMSTGAQATRAIAELVLLDNKFSRLPNVLSEGRRVIANIERVANLFVIKNVYSLLLAVSVTVAAIPYPFLPRHLTILSALTIGIPAFFLALAPNNRRYIAGFLPRVLRFAIPVGLLIATMVVIVFYVIQNNGGSLSLASTMSASVVMGIGVWVLVCLARPLVLWKIALILLMAVSFVALLLIPFARAILGLEFDLMYIWLVSGLIAVGIVVVEAVWRLDQKVKD